MKKNERYLRHIPKIWRSKTMLIMKQFIVLILIFNFNAFSGVLGQEIKEFKITDANLKECIQKIEKLTNLGFLYKGYELKKVHGITVKVRNSDVNDLLHKVLKNTGYVHEINQGIILIKKELDNQPKKVLVKGKVTDEKGNPLPGVSVVIKDTSIGVSTDIDGTYKIELPEVTNATALVFSFIGMKTQEIKVKGKKQFDVKLVEENQKIEEVVITGYANINKKSFTGNAKTIDRAEIIKTSPKNVMQSLQLLDPSLRIINADLNGSNPNNVPEFYIRGKSGVGTTELDQLDESNIRNNPNLPTFILDGFEVGVEKIYDLDINLIKNITILKDAAATAIYGSRAANGVIVIERIAPKSGQLRVSYNLNLSFSTPDLRDYNLFNAKEKLEAEKLSGLFDVDPSYIGFSRYYRTLKAENNLRNKSLAISKGIDTDWLAVPTRNAVNQRHSFYMEGGHEDLLFGADIKINRDNGVMKGSYRNSKSFGFQLTYRMNNVTFKNYFSYELCESEESPYGTFSSYTEYNPYISYKNMDGTYPKVLDNYGGYRIFPNPILASTIESYDKKNYNAFTNNFSFDWYITSALRLKNSISYYHQKDNSGEFNDPAAINYELKKGETFFDSGNKNVSNSETKNLAYTALLMFNKTINSHNINLSYGLNMREKKYNNLNFLLKGFPNGILNEINFAAKIDNKPGNDISKQRLFGTFFTSNYSFKDIYLFDFSFRLDGSSVFGTEKKYAPFWSSGIGLNLHEYEFINNIESINFFKVRASIGETGKTNFPANSAKNTYRYNFDEWFINGIGTIMSSLGNENLKWEITNTLDFGFDIKLFNNKFCLKADYYIKTTKDLINQMTVPASLGFKTYYTNVGELENRGYELFFNSFLIQTKDTKLNLFATVIHNENKMLKISKNLQDYNDRVNDYYESKKNSWGEYTFNKPLLKYREGASLTSIYAMKSIGINPANGREVFLTKDGDITYDWEASENVVCGNTEPDLSGNFGLNLNHKRFSLYAAFIYEIGGQIYNQTLCDKVEEADINYNADKRILSDRWKQPGDVTPLKDIKDWGERTMPTSRFVQDNDLLSLQSLTLSYDVPKRYCEKIRMSLLKIQFNTDNLFRFSKAKQERGVYYPYARTFNLTLNAKF